MNDLPPGSWGFLLAIAATAGGLIVHYGLPLIRRNGSSANSSNGRWQGQVTEILGQNSRTLEAMSRSLAQMTELLSELVRRPYKEP